MALTLFSSSTPWPYIETLQLRTVMTVILTPHKMAATAILAMMRPDTASDAVSFCSTKIPTEAQRYTGKRCEWLATGITSKALKVKLISINLTAVVCEENVEEASKHSAFQDGVDDHDYRNDREMSDAHSVTVLVLLEKIEGNP